MDWISLTYAQTIGIIISGIGIYIALMIFVRINGLRTLSKMSAHDFAVTIAIGSIVGATVSSKDPSLSQGALAIAVLIFLQFCYSVWRLKRPKNYFENTPLLLMEGPHILEENLKKSRVTETDLIAKLREANVLDRNEIKAVVLEVTGDVSVLHGDKEIDDYLMKDVYRKSETQ